MGYVLVCTRRGKSTKIAAVVANSSPYNSDMTEFDRIGFLIMNIAHCVVDQTEAVKIDAIRQDGGMLYRLNVSPTDLGKIIGKQGRMARSIRVILGAISMKLNQKFSLDIVND